MIIVLPQKWCLKITKENIDIIGKWRTAGGYFQSHHIGGYVNSRSEPSFKGYYDKDKNKDEIELNWEEFQQLVLKIKPINPSYEIY